MAHACGPGRLEWPVFGLQPPDNLHPDSSQVAIILAAGWRNLFQAFEQPSANNLVVAFLCSVDFLVVSKVRILVKVRVPGEEHLHLQVRVKDRVTMRVRIG